MDYSYFKITYQRAPFLMSAYLGIVASYWANHVIGDCLSFYGNVVILVRNDVSVHCVRRSA